MSNIEALPDFLLNTQLFYEFNNQFIKSINEKTPFRVTNYYNDINESPQKIWNDQVIMHCDKNINVEKEYFPILAKGMILSQVM